MTDLAKTEIRGSILEIVLNRPEKRNAINGELYAAFDSAVDDAARLSDIRAVLVRGEGKVFSAGIDYTDFLRLSEEYGPRWQQRMRKITDDFQRVLTNLERLELPTIALLHGYCLGLAMELALACDIRIAAQGTKLGLPETLLGMIPDVGGTTRLVRLVGPARAKELIFTGRQIDTTQAERWGIVNHVVSQEELLQHRGDLSRRDQPGCAACCGHGQARHRRPGRHRPRPDARRLGPEPALFQRRLHGRHPGQNDAPQTRLQRPLTPEEHP